MDIAIIGALGTLGRNVCSALAKFPDLRLNKFDIRYDDNSRNFLDIRNLSDVKEKLKNIDVIIHLAAISRVAWAEQKPDLAWEINTKGTLNIVKACLDFKKKPWIIFASSREVYGNSDCPNLITEKSQCLPLNAYGKTKLASENILIEASKLNLPILIMRFSNIYGTMYDWRDRVIPAFCIAALRNEEIIVKGAESIVDFIHINDAVLALIKAINLIKAGKFLSPNILNICSSMPIMLGQLAKLIMEYSNSQSKIRFLPKDPSSVGSFFGSNELAFKTLLLQPHIKLNQGINNFLNDLSNTNKSSAIYTSSKRGLILNESFKSYSWLPAEI